MRGTLSANYTYYYEKNASTQDENALSEQHKNELFTNRQPGLDSRVIGDFGRRREGIRVLSIAIMAIQTYWEMAQLRVLKHRT